MTTRTIFTSIAAASFVLGASVFVAPNSHAQESAVEKLYAELFKLDPAERHARIIAGAAKESKALLRPSFRSRIGTAMIKSFEKQYPNVEAGWHMTTSSAAAETFVAEARAGRYLMDVTNGAISELSVVLDADIVASYPTPANDRILPKYKPFMDPKNRWVLSHANDMGIGFNAKFVSDKDKPKSWEDLCSPRFKGAVSYEPNQIRWLVGLYNMYGGDEEKVQSLLECIGKNDPIVMKGNTAKIMLMVAGDHNVAANISIAGGIDMHKKNPDKVPFAVNFDIPLFTYAEGFVISKHTAHPYKAALLMDWVLGPDNQQLIADNSRGPVTMKHPYHPDDVKLVPIGFIELDILNRLQDYWTKYVGRQ